MIESYFFFFFWLCPWRAEVPGPGIQSKPQLPPIPQLQQHQILNPLHWAGAQTPTSAVTCACCSQILNPLYHSENFCCYYFNDGRDLRRLWAPGKDIIEN